MRTIKAKCYKIVPDKNYQPIEKVKITSSKAAADFSRKFYFEDINVYESVFIIMLNRSNTTIGWAKISQGGVSSCLVDNILIAKFCVENLAKGVILVHNHPSGELRPSDADISVTKKLVNGLKFLEINVLDHIILTDTSYYSLLDNGHF